MFLHMRSVRCLGIFAFIIFIAVSPGRLAGAKTDGSKKTPSEVGIERDQRTPFQESVMKKLAERKSKGLPVAKNVSFTYKTGSGVNLENIIESSTQPRKSNTIVATTIIRYGSPAEAGFRQWPVLFPGGVIPPGANNDGQLRSYSGLLRERVEKAIPGFWEVHQFGQEPRTHMTTERCSLPMLSPILEKGNGLGGASEHVVMGFTIDGPKLDCTIEESISVCDLEVCELASFKAGFELDWKFGIRLPLQVDLNTIRVVEEGSRFTPTTTVTAKNFTAEDFESSNVAGREGNEFLMGLKFFAGVKLKILDIELFPGLNIDIDKDNSKSFTTPLGPNEAFPLGEINIPIKTFRKTRKIKNDDGEEEEEEQAAVTIGLALGVDIGSDKFKMKWSATSDAPDDGALEVSDSGQTKELNRLLAVDGPGEINISISEFEYVFTIAILRLGLYGELVLTDWPICTDSGDCRYTTPKIPLNVSDYFPGFSIDIHKDSRPMSVNASVEILNVNPEATIISPTTMPINEVQTFLARVGDELTFKGTATDPGYDDLTLEWDWNDGGDAPDRSTFYPKPLEITLPVVAMDSPNNTFEDACLYQVTFRAKDDDRGMDEKQIPVLIQAEPGNRSRLSGYWKHQLRGNGNTDFDEQALQCYLDITQHMSKVFSEARYASTIPLAARVMFLNGDSDDEGETKNTTRNKFDRELLVLWLNFANGVFDYYEMVDTDGDGGADVTFGSAVNDAEMVRVDPQASEREIKDQTKILHHISNSKTGNYKYPVKSPNFGKEISRSPH